MSQLWSTPKAIVGQTSFVSSSFIVISFSERPPLRVFFPSLYAMSQCPRPPLVCVCVPVVQRSTCPSFRPWKITVAWASVPNGGGTRRVAPMCMRVPSPSPLLDKRGQRHDGPAVNWFFSLFFSFFLDNLFLVLPFLCFARTVLAVFLVRGWTGFAVALDRRRRRRWTGSPTGKIASGSNVRRAAVSATALCVQRGQSFHSYSSFADQRACLFEGIAR